MPGPSFTLRNVEIGDAQTCDVTISHGVIVSIGKNLTPNGLSLDGRGGALIPGLHDHHIHLLATAALTESVDLENARSVDDVAKHLTGKAISRPPGSWIRATNIDAGTPPEIDRTWLDRICPKHPVRMKDRTGALWLLNTAALDLIQATELPAGFERDDAGQFTGRIWREDGWLAKHLPHPPPSLKAIGEQLTRCGVTSVTDASVTTDASSAALLADAHRSGDLPQRLHLMSGGALEAPGDGAFAIAAVKILPDERNLPDLDDMIGQIARARREGRNVAVHCVTATELAFTLAAFEAAGTRAGDRIEHGSVIDAAAIPVLKDLGLSVVTQPGFIEARGDRYLRNIPEAEHPDLYRTASLISAGIPVRASSDAPYGPADPWAGIRSATRRQTRDGHLLGQQEQTNAETALNLYFDWSLPAGTARESWLKPGMPADVCLLDTPLRGALENPSAEHVAATFINGLPVYDSHGDYTL